VARAVATLAAERHGANDLPGGIYHVHLPEFRVGNVCGSAGALEHRHSEAPLAGTAAAAADVAHGISGEVGHHQPLLRHVGDHDLAGCDFAEAVDGGEGFVEFGNRIAGQVD